MKLPEHQNLEEKENIFFTYKKIDTTTEVESFLSSLDDNSYIYRGVNEARYKMFTSVQREWITNGFEKHKSINDMIDILIRNIRNNYILNDYYKSLNIVQTDLLHLSFLQHYSAPTPLLDFSHSAKVALFFATQKLAVSQSNSDIDEYFSLYYLNSQDPNLMRMDSFFNKSLQNGKELLEEYMQQHPDIDVDASILDDLDKSSRWDGILNKMKVVFIDNPLHAKKVTTPYAQNTLYWSNLNIIAQQGCFILYNNESNPKQSFEEFVGKKINCIDIHKSLANYIKKQYLNGVSESSLFPNNRQIAQDAYMQFKEQL